MHETRYGCPIHRKTGILSKQIMKKNALVLILLILIQIKGIGQIYNSDQRPPGNSHQVSMNILVPVDQFALSHSFGFGLFYQWSNQHFGRSDQFKIDSLNRLSFLAGGGVEYYFGKEDINTAGYQFSFDNYFYIHVMPGIHYRFAKNADMSFLLGPTLGIYNSNASFGVGANLQAQYYLRSNISLGPTLLFKKHSDADALWSVGLKVGYNFGF